MGKDLEREIALSTPRDGRKSKISRLRSYWRAFFRFYSGEPERIEHSIIDQSST